MRASRRQFLVAGAAAAVAAACTPMSGPGAPPCVVPNIGGVAPLPAPGSAGLVDEAWWAARCDEFLAVGTQSLDGDNLNNVAAHLIRARRDPSFVWDPSQVSPNLVTGDPFRDTDDFELMYVQWVLRLGRDVLPPAVITAMEDKIVGARYRYDDPLPAGQVDNKWFWSENHRGMFACDEYLGGLAVPDRVFTFTGLTGAQHAARTRQVVIDWLRERTRFGFFEWHSNTYLKFTYAPVLTLLEFADDPEIKALCAGVADTAMLDLATNTFQCVFGASHGRGYKAGKLSWNGESSFNTCKLLFDTTDKPFNNGNDIGPLYLIGQTDYRVPEAVRRAGVSQEPAVVRERHGLPLDPREDFNLDPQGAFGYDYTTENLPFWWSTGALTAWQMVPVSLEAAKKWRLFDTELFQKFAKVKDFLDVSPGLAQIAVRELAGFAAAGVLGEAHTYSWRSAEAMLECVVDHRFGDSGEQVHAWQATLGPETTVFTIHPMKEAPSDGYWVGTASMPKSAQKERAAIHIYRPSYDSPTDPLLGPYFSYLPFTRAWFPQDRFDEVRQANGWTLGRKGHGSVALWSERPTQWRPLNPADSASNGMTQPYDLVAPGGASNVWVCEVGGASDHGDFDSFVAAITSATVEVVRTNGQIDVHYVSPVEGDLRLGTLSGFQVDGQATPLRNHPRHSSPWGESCEFSSYYDLQVDGARVRIDGTTGARVLN